MVSANDRINELQNQIRELQTELTDLQIGDCPRCGNVLVKCPNDDTIVSAMTAGKNALTTEKKSTKYATAHYTWRCWYCSFPAANWKQQPEHSNGVFGYWLNNKSEALLMAGSHYPEAEKFEITFEPTFAAPAPDSTGLKHQLLEGVAMGCPKVEITDEHGRLKSDTQMEKDYPDLFDL